MVGQQKIGNEAGVTRSGMMTLSGDRLSGSRIRSIGSAMLLRTLLPLALVGLSSCATMNHGGEQGESLSPVNESRAVLDDDQASERIAAGAESSEAPEKTDRIITGDDRSSIRPPEVREPLKLYGDAVSMNFEEAPLADVVHSILGDTLNLD